MQRIRGRQAFNSVLCWRQTRGKAHPSCSVHPTTKRNVTRAWSPYVAHVLRMASRRTRPLCPSVLSTSTSSCGAINAAARSARVRPVHALSNVSNSQRCLHQAAYAPFALKLKTMHTHARACTRACAHNHVPMYTGMYNTRHSLQTILQKKNTNPPNSSKLAKQQEQGGVVVQALNA